MKKYFTIIAMILTIGLTLPQTELQAQVRRSDSGTSSSRTTTRSSASPSSGAGRSSSVSRSAQPSASRSTSNRNYQAEVSRNNVRPASVNVNSSRARNVVPGGVQVHRNPSAARRPAPAPVPLQAGRVVPVHRVPPVERGFLPYDYRPVFHGDCGVHYYGYRVRYLPVGYKVYRYHDVVYYYYDGIYYRPYGEYYMVCRPPVGVSVAATATGLALTAITCAVVGAVVNNANNAAADAANSANAAAEAAISAANAANAAANAANAAATAITSGTPVCGTASAGNSTHSGSVINNGNGTVSPAPLPQQTLGQSLGLSQVIPAANTQYYYQDGVFYELVNGEYKVIVAPAGAQVETIPDDYEMVTLNGQQYYKVDDTVYTVVVNSNGSPVFEVLGQMTA